MPPESTLVVDVAFFVVPNFGLYNHLIETCAKEAVEKPAINAVSKIFFIV